MKGCEKTSACDCSVSRRAFLAAGCAGAAGLLAGQLPVVAGPFEAADFEKLVPADKKLDAAWVKSLFARGAPTEYRGKELDLIGMPVGGIAAGQLYLGGDGTLWHWDLFNRRIRSHHQAHYTRPAQPRSPLAQGFALRIGAHTRPLDRTGFAEISFRGEYPIATVEYKDPAAPVAVTLRAFSPFVPLNTADSSLPATVMQFTVRNTSAAAVNATLLGTLENAVCLHHRGKATGTVRNRTVAGEGFTLLECSAEGAALEKLFDFGTMGLALLGAPAEQAARETAAPLGEKLLGQLGRTLSLAPGQSATVTFVLAWHFPNMSFGRRIRESKRFYATRFPSAAAVARYVAENFDRLEAETRRWHDTWYDSTLPYWFLDRTFLNTSILATSTCHRFSNGRFYAWEGVGCCAGTCTSVWYYAHAVARLFPELERSVREMQDFADGAGFDPATGGVYTRAEWRGDFVLDGQAGNVLRIYREHQMSAEAAFLRRNWAKTKKALGWLIGQDGNSDGIVDGLQSTTLDCGLWWGAIAWTSLLYVAALRAGAAMAREMGDEEFVRQCERIAEAGTKNIVERLFNGEYFIHKPDPNQPKSFIIGNGCHIDQVYAQEWANQVGLGRILPAKHTLSALRAIWKYNFTPDVGPYRRKNAPGRWFAVAGEGGVIMTTWPRGDRQDPKLIEGNMTTGVGYLNECWTGQEHQVAAHMIEEGMVTEGMVIERVVHDRHHPLRRNPWNEIECGDHYARAMASYGVFLAACGYEYHGPKGHLGFAPRISPDDFRAAFTAAEGWGTFRQRREGAGLRAAIELRYGRLRLKTLALAIPKDAGLKQVTVKLGESPLASVHAVADGRVTITLDSETAVGAGQAMEVFVSW